MRPLVFQFLASPSEKVLDHSMIEYDANQNLSVIKNTQIPAITFANMDTETFTRTQVESSDSDRPDIDCLIDTATHTLVNAEQVDSDQGIGDILALMDTSTITESAETVDQDKPPYNDFNNYAQN